MKPLTPCVRVQLVCKLISYSKLDLIYMGSFFFKSSLSVLQTRSRLSSFYLIFNMCSGLLFSCWCLPIFNGNLEFWLLWKLSHGWPFLSYGFAGEADAMLARAEASAKALAAVSEAIGAAGGYEVSTHIFLLLPV